MLRDRNRSWKLKFRAKKGNDPQSEIKASIQEYTIRERG